MTADSQIVALSLNKLLHMVDALKDIWSRLLRISVCHGITGRLG